MSRLSRLLIFVCAPIFLGAFLYYVFCPDVYFVSVIDNSIGTGFHLSLDMESIFVKYFRFYLFDFLWSFSLTALLRLIVDDEAKSIYSILLSSSLVFVCEIMQIFPGIVGTFDICDIVVEIVAVIIASNYLPRRKKREKI